MNMPGGDHIIRWNCLRGHSFPPFPTKLASNGRRPFKISQKGKCQFPPPPSLAPFMPRGALFNRRFSHPPFCPFFLLLFFVPSVLLPIHFPFFIHIHAFIEQNNPKLNLHQFNFYSFNSIPAKCNSIWGERGEEGRLNRQHSLAMFSLPSFLPINFLKLNGRVIGNRRLAEFLHKFNPLHCIFYNRPPFSPKKFLKIKRNKFTSIFTF